MTLLEQMQQTRRDAEGDARRNRDAWDEELSDDGDRDHAYDSGLCAGRIEVAERVEKYLREHGGAMFTFNGDYHDLDQVAQWVPEFEAVFAEVSGGRNFAYDADFVDRIPGIANKEKRRHAGTHEDAAIYLLQRRRHLAELEQRVRDALAGGYEKLDGIDAGAAVRFADIIAYDEHGWSHWAAARLVHTPRGVFVLPKGARSRGFEVGSRKLLVRS